MQNYNVTGLPFLKREYSIISFIVKCIRKISRKKRGCIFINEIRPVSEDRILDIGSENGTDIYSIIPDLSGNVYIADIALYPLRCGKEKYGFKSIMISGRGGLPFKDKTIDVIFCSSAIEHVTGSKEETLKYKTWKQFYVVSLENQLKFANEIRRVSKKYFVQTPYKYFPIETHTWLPLISYLPRKVLLLLLPFLNKYWIKKTSADWCLLSKREMASLFPDAIILKEKFLFFTKSLIAIRK